jgi:hypothetical protein
MDWLSWFWRNRVRSLLYSIERNGKMAVVSSINLTVNGPAVHVTVTDQNGNPLSPQWITWETIPLASNVTIDADSTGFNFSVSDTSATSLQAKASYGGPGVNESLIGPNLVINIAAPASPPATVTSLQYMSP